MNFLWGGAGLLAVLLVANMKRKEETKLANSKTSDINEHRKRNKNKEGFKLGDITISPKNMNNGVWIVGPPGVGKSTKIFMYNLLRNEFPRGSKIITDLKGEIYNTTKTFRDGLGEECYLFEPLNPNSEFKYNPLEFCENEEEVIQLAHNILVEESEGSERKWQEMAFPLWAGVLVWAYKQPLKDRNIPSAINLLKSLNFKNIKQELSKYERSKELFNNFMVCGGSEATISSILITLMTNIQVYTDTRIQNNIRSSSINPLQLKNINTNIYIKYGIGDINYLKQFLKVFYSQLMQKTCTGTKGKQVIFMLDECQNIGKIPSFEHYCAFCRSSNVSMIIGTQDLNTLYSVYGVHQAKSIINSMETKVVFPRLTDIDALNFIQNICGEIEIKVKEGEIEKKYKKHLFSITDIRTLSDNEAILIIENVNPIKVRLTPYFEDKKLMKNIEGIKIGEVKWL